MRHRVEGRKFNRTASHRKALLRSLATHLLRHKRIQTTEAKAKEASRFADAIITRAKRAYAAEKSGGAVDVHARRVVARDINDNDVVKELFKEIVAKVGDRPGGYTRVIKLPPRHGDAASMAILELVDYNTERDERSAHLRSKSTVSRDERVARSRAKQAAADAKKAAVPAPAPVPVVAEEVTPTEEEPVEPPPAEAETAAPDAAADEPAAAADDEKPAE